MLIVWAKVSSVNASVCGFEGEQMPRKQPSTEHDEDLCREADDYRGPKQSQSGRSKTVRNNGVALAKVYTKS